MCVCVRERERERERKREREREVVGKIKYILVHGTYILFKNRNVECSLLYPYGLVLLSLLINHNISLVKNKHCNSLWIYHLVKEK